MKKSVGGFKKLLDLCPARTEQSLFELDDLVTQDGSAAHVHVGKVRLTPVDEKCR